METKRYQERPTPDNAVLLLIDHQVGLFTGVRDIPVAELKHNVVALAKAVKVLGVPLIVTATSPEMWGPIIPELTEALPGIISFDFWFGCMRPQFCDQPNGSSSDSL